jgi:S-DNA-T family DNA segregation ATPase FtsK/SpoIIIE
MKTDLSQLSSKSTLPILLGTDESGVSHLVDLAQTGNIIMGGSTGSGKSMCMHTIITSLMLKHEPTRLKFFLADPKDVEFSHLYNKIPHLLGKVYTRPAEIIQQLVLLKAELAQKSYEYVVILIDTFSDLMAYDSAQFESVIADLSKLNDNGVYSVLCDSRIGSSVFSDRILSYFPTRIAFRSPDAESSELLIGQAGAENLRGSGDMLFLHKGDTTPIKLQAPYISEEDIQKMSAQS